MNRLEQTLGKVMTTQEVSEFLKIDIKTVRKYYLQLGGVRFGRAYRFFERRISDAIQAQWKMDCSSKGAWQDQEKIISQEKTSNRMGGKTKKETCRAKGNRDPYNLLA